MIKSDERSQQGFPRPKTHVSEVVFSNRTSETIIVTTTFYLIETWSITPQYNRTLADAQSRILENMLEMIGSGDAVMKEPMPALS